MAPAISSCQSAALRVRLVCQADRLLSVAGSESDLSPRFGKAESPKPPVEADRPLDARRHLRPDLRLLVMSATLDGARFAGLMGGAPVIESHGRSHAIELLYLGRAAERRIEDEVAAACRRALGEAEGSLLAFLPGVAEIERTAREGLLMPPKSTFFTPKLRTGFVIRPL